MKSGVRYFCLKCDKYHHGSERTIFIKHYEARDISVRNHEKHITEKKAFKKLAKEGVLKERKIGSLTAYSIIPPALRR
jgi:hypothetical protein